MREINLRKQSRKFLNPVADFLVKVGISPHFLTWLGLLSTVVPFLFIIRGNFLCGGITLGLVSLFDILDGEVARKADKTTKFGGLLDSTIDRLQEAVIIFGYIIFFRAQFLAIFLLYFYLVFSYLISYVRARGEGLGFSTQKGPMDRSGRYVLLVLFTILGQKVFLIGLGLIDVLLFLTFFRRVWDLRKNLKK